LSKQHNKEEKPKNSETFYAIAQFSQIGVTMAASVLVGVLLGKYLDGLIGTKPWLLLIFSLLGAGAAIKVLFNISKDKK
jgi:ATP synthase protein I